MKKTIVMCLVFSMILGAVGCAKVKPKPTLAEAFAVFEDKSLTYDSEIYPYEFTQEEIDNADDESKKKAKDMYDKFCDLMFSYDSDRQEKLEKLGVSGIVNKYFLIDYVLRAGLHNDQEEFRNRYALINDLIIMDGLDNFNSMIFCLIVYQVSDDDLITADVADCIVPVMKEYMPDINDKTYTESKEMAKNAMLAQVFYRDVLKTILWCGKGEKAAEEWSKEGFDRVEQWANLAKSLPDD